MLSRVGAFLVDAVDHGPARMLLLLAIFLVFGAVDFAIGAVITSLHVPFLVHGLIDAFVLGGLITLAAWMLLEAARRRRRLIRQEMEESARLNHEIRNALEVIAQAGYLVNDVVYGRAIAESVHRIEKTLRDRPDETAE